MKRNLLSSHTWLFILLSFIFCQCPFICSQNIDSLIKQLENSDWRIRDETISLLSGYLGEEKVRIAIINLLEKETKAMYTEPEKRESEGFGEYYIHITETVCKMKGDPKIIIPLINTFGIIGGKRVAETIAEFGTLALPHLIEKVKDENSIIRRDVIYTIEIMLEKKKVPIDKYSLIKGVLFTGLEDKSLIVRIQSIEALRMLKSDKDVVEKIKEISFKDPDFKVREEAKKFLQKGE